MWSYSTVNRTLSRDGEVVGSGYSGNTTGLNNPEMESVKDIGPVPRGQYTIGPFFNDVPGKGPIVAHLIPQPATATFGRSGFMIHGDNAAADESASHGCIILAHPLRESIATSSDTNLEVV